MSETTGSPFGGGAFGRGPYSGDSPTETPGAIVAASRVQAAGVVTRQAEIAMIEGMPMMLAVGHPLWQTDPAECGPWTAIGGGVTGLPNSAGGMFP